MFIYLIMNIINGMYYVGKTKGTVLSRFKNHIYFSKNPKYVKADVYLYRAMRKYGVENFTVETLSRAFSIKELNNLEKLWIITLRSYDNEIGYNLTFGGDGGLSGFHHSDKTKKKMSAWQLGKTTRTSEQKEHLSTLYKGKVWITNDITCKLVDKVTILPDGWRYGMKPFSEEQCRNMSRSKIGKAPWNKGKRGCQVAWNRGMKKTK